jgi:hypothetical protein
MRTVDDFFDGDLQKSLYHYSGIGALLGIANSETLWASNVYYLNDGEEVIYAKKIFKKLVAEKQLQVRGDKAEFLRQFCEWLEPFSGGAFNLFVFSLSEEQNLLSQWRSYTPHGRGVSIGFSPFIVRKIAEKNSLKIAKCHYERQEHLEVMNALLEKMIVTFDQHFPNIDPKDFPGHQRYHPFLERFRGNILQVFAIIKNPAFKEEQEWRLISGYFPKYTVQEIKYREGASMLVPYIELKLERWHDLPQHSHPVFFESVCLGPSPHSNLSFNALSQFLSNRKVAHMTINSNVPYRKWQ